MNEIMLQNLLNSMKRYKPKRQKKTAADKELEIVMEKLKKMK